MRVDRRVFGLTARASLRIGGLDELSELPVDIDGCTKVQPRYGGKQSRDD